MTEPRTGKVDLGSGKAQHVDLWRKVKLRRELLEELGQGAAFVPFIGEADIALELYADRAIVGIELDPDVAGTATRRLADRSSELPAIVIAGNAEHPHEIPERVGAFAIVDVDAFSNPYRTLAVAWPRLELAERVAVFGTDGMRLAIRRSKTRLIGPLPDGKLSQTDINTRRRQWNTWWPDHVRPYLEQLFAPGRIVAERKYLRDHMLYWGVVVDRRTTDLEPASRQPAGDSPADAEIKPGAPPVDATSPATDLAKVEAALLEAATAGNVAAAIFWLEHKGGPTWQKAEARFDVEHQTRPLTSRARARRDA